MKPPYDITPEILQLLTEVSEKIGAIHARYLDRPAPQLRKQNRIRTIHSSLQIEGNTLNEAQVTAIVENKRVSGPPKDILEVLNAMRVYNRIGKYRPFSEKSFLAAHRSLMAGLSRNAGTYRKKSVGIVKGSHIQHIAPPAKNIPFLMKDLFRYLETDPDIPLIKSCVFHYELEFIHSFMDGNGRMGRLWQAVILLQSYPVFEFLPFETLIRHDQDGYYKALSQSDREGRSTAFIRFMLQIINASLAELLAGNNRTLNDTDRLAYFASQVKGPFTRKDYMHLFKEISPATASRDLKKGVEQGLFRKSGDKKTTVYITNSY
ncbi:MAG: Fic family protein [Bacteroidia bacterium]|nr:Fic family protein [Bacteroidia bacterium]